MAGHRRGNPFQRVLDLGPAIQSLEILGKRAQRGPRSRSRVSSAGNAVTRSESPPNSSISNPSRSSSAACPTSAWRRRGRHLHQHRLEQTLALQPAARQPLGDPLEQHALVRDVLVDDRDAVFIHGDDECVPELPEGHQGLQPRCRCCRCDWLFAGRCNACSPVGAIPLTLVGATEVRPAAPTVQRLGKTAAYACGSGSVAGCPPWRGG